MFFFCCCYYLIQQRVCIEEILKDKKDTFKINEFGRKARDTEFGMIKKGSSFSFFYFFHVNTSLVILRYSIYFNFLDAFALYILYYRYI